MAKPRAKPGQEKPGAELPQTFAGGRRQQRQAGAGDGQHHRPPVGDAGGDKTRAHQGNEIPCRDDEKQRPGLGVGDVQILLDRRHQGRLDDARHEADKKKKGEQKKLPQAGLERFPVIRRCNIGTGRRQDAHQRISTPGRRSACACARFWMCSTTMLTAISSGVSAPIEIPSWPFANLIDRKRPLWAAHPAPGRQ